MERKWKVLGLIAIVLIVVFVSWNMIGTFLLKDVLEFEFEGKAVYENENAIYQLFASGRIDGIDSKNTQIQYTHEAENIFKLMKEELHFKSMLIGFSSPNFPSKTYYAEYVHFYFNYYIFLQNKDKDAWNCTFNISSQENSSYLEFRKGTFTIRTYVKHDDDLTDYLKSLFPLKN